MSWPAIALPLIAATAVVVVLGVPIALALRARGYALITIPVVATFANLSISPTLAALAGVPWSLLPAAALSLAITVLLLPFWRLLAHRDSRHPLSMRRTRRQLIMPLGFAGLGGALVMSLMVRHMWAPDAVSQTYDANFHLNLVRAFLDSGNASPLNVDLSSPGRPTFYPAVWHAFVALIAQLSNASVPLATNAGMLFVVGVVWPIGVVAMSRALFGPSRRVAFVAGVVAASLPSVPYTLASYGVLYPNMLSMLLLPFALTGLIKLLHHGRADTTDPLSPIATWLTFLAALGAASVAHPTALYTFVLLATPAVMGAVVRGWRIGGAHRAGSVMGGVATLGFIAGLWYLGRTSDNTWDTQKSFIGSVLEGALGAPRLGSNAAVLLLLILLSFVVTVRQRRLRWLGLAWIVSVVFYGISNGFPWHGVRTLLTGPWYNDSWRLAAVVAIAAVPLLVLVLTRMVSLLRFTLRHRLRSDNRRRTTIAAIAAAALLITALQSPGIGAVALYVQSKYEPRADHAPLLDEDERTLLDRIDENVPEDATLINNPWNGGALAEALTGRNVLIPHTGGSYPEDHYDLIQGIPTGEHEACQLAAKYHAYFVLDFGTDYVFPDTERAEPFTSISDVDPEFARALEEIDREGEAVLYAVVGCP